jgi:hypothetical protein
LGKATKNSSLMIAARPIVTLHRPEITIKVAATNVKPVAVALPPSTGYSRPYVSVSGRPGPAPARPPAADAACRAPPLAEPACSCPLLTEAALSLVLGAALTRQYEPAGRPVIARRG